ncbi:hypothetical protein [Chryseobacterium sp. SIMBA_038]|uniref:hypothetical protein n=1 Tax=Chryseobacterium sp. SIMBA_038 TaxID=3085780 RepID=UPI00397CBABF
MKYKILAVLIIIIYFFQPFFLPTGGIGADSLSYFGIASDLPNLKTNLFPLGYPVLLEICHFFVKDYFWASKILNFVFIVGILSFSYFKRFYFRETVLLLAGKTAFFVFCGVISEGPFIFFLYFLFYFLHQMFSGKKLYVNAVEASLMMICMFTVRYSGIYVYLSILIFLFFTFLKLRKEKFFTPLLLFAFLSGLGIGGYLLFNYLYFGSFTGEDLRGAPGELIPIYVLRDLLGVSNVIDPYIGIKPASNSIVSIGFQFLILGIDILMFRYFLTYYKKAKETSLYYFHILIWIMAVTYALSLMVSGWFQQIEEMNMRMMAAANFCLFFSFLILYFQKETSDKVIWRVGCFFLVFLSLYNIKSPDNYLKNKNQIRSQVSKFKGKKYIYNDEKAMKNITVYHIPVINKSFSYQHTNKQKGELKQSLVGSIDPQIKWVKYDTVKNKSQVLYTSQLILN